MVNRKKCKIIRKNHRMISTKKHNKKEKKEEKEEKV